MLNVERWMLNVECSMSGSAHFCFLISQFQIFAFDVGCFKFQRFSFSEFPWSRGQWSVVRCPVHLPSSIFALVISVFALKIRVHPWSTTLNQFLIDSNPSTNNPQPLMAACSSIG